MKLAIPITKEVCDRTDFNECRSCAIATTLKEKYLKFDIGVLENIYSFWLAKDGIIFSTDIPHARFGGEEYLQVKKTGIPFILHVDIPDEYLRHSDLMASEVINTKEEENAIK